MFGLVECYLFIFLFLIISFAVFFSPIYDRIREKNNCDAGAKITQIIILASYVFIALGILYYMSQN
jgi:hypothetical protein